MTFEEALQEHLRTIRDRDLQGLAATVAPDELILITAEGELFTTTAKFLELHEEWFASTSWSLHADVAHIDATDDMGIAVLRLDYRDTTDEGPVRQESILTLVFRRFDDRWLLVQDQNTPVQG